MNLDFVLGGVARAMIKGMDTNLQYSVASGD
jgi:hypothetical protein